MSKTPKKSSISARGRRSRAQPSGIRSRKCSVCKHPEIARIDYLLVSASGEPGSGRRSLGQKFGLCPDSLYHHAQHHISVEHRKAVLAGPFRSEDDLRQLVAEEGVGVLQNFRGLFNAHRARWLVALESGDDAVMINHR